jgi:bacterioferritin
MPTDEKSKVTRKQLIDGLNEDLSREYQAIISYVNYSQVLKGAAYMNIADELAVHAKEELTHALKIANHIDYLGGMPSVTPTPVKTSENAEDMLKFDLANEKETIRQYRRRVRQADELNEFAIAESLRGILVEEQDHLIALATALGVDPPDAGVCICYVEQPSSAKIQYAVRRLNKKNPGESIVLALLGLETCAPLSIAGPDVAEGPFSVALKAIGEAASAISQGTLDSKDQNMIGKLR